MLMEMPSIAPSVHASMVPNLVSAGGSYRFASCLPGSLLLPSATMTPRKSQWRNPPTTGPIPHSLNLPFGAEMSNSFAGWEISYFPISDQHEGWR